ncbi:MAG: ribosomal protein S18-alanine N-acetyltransferase [Oscillospiraceae bacterium]|nr:ribosomal protein S18-alanine N-acetyltransferase [Oscillospiraceae bacterium]
MMPSDNMITIDLAREDDLPWVSEIEQEAFAPPWSLRSITAEISDPDAFFAVARDAEEVLGYVILRRLVDQGELLKIAVRKGDCHRGVGKKLLSAALVFAQESNLDTIFLEVRESNAAAISLYLQYGFRPLRQRKDYYVNPVEDALEMILKLSVISLY